MNEWENLADEPSMRGAAFSLNKTPSSSQIFQHSQASTGIHSSKHLHRFRSKLWLSQKLKFFEFSAGELADFKVIRQKDGTLNLRLLNN